jgi:hypothetical protein
VEGFKSRPLYATLAVRNLRIDNRLYLVLQTPIEGRQQVIVTATNLDGDSAPSTHFCADGGPIVPIAPTILNLSE